MPRSSKSPPHDSPRRRQHEDGFDNTEIADLLDLPRRNQSQRLQASSSRPRAQERTPPAPAFDRQRRSRAASQELPDNSNQRKKPRNDQARPIQGAVFRDIQPQDPNRQPILAQPPSRRNQQTGFILPNTPRAPAIPTTQAFWSRKGLFRIVNNPDDWDRINICCTKCDWVQKNKDRTIGGSGNLTRHYQSKHKDTPADENAEVLKIQHDQQAKHGQNNQPANFFTAANSDRRDKKFRDLLVAFFVQNNLSFRVVDQGSFRDLISFIAPTMKVPSRRTLTKDIEQAFAFAQDNIKQQLQAHMNGGGRFSCTTDCWSANNGKDFMAVTIHYIDKESWDLTSFVLDCRELTEPVHSGQYLCRELLAVLDEYDITKALFTVTRDNASPNTVMLEELEKAIKDRYLVMGAKDQAFYGMRFKVSNGDIACSGHVINISVQDGTFFSMRVSYEGFSMRGYMRGFQAF